MRKSRLPWVLLLAVLAHGFPAPAAAASQSEPRPLAAENSTPDQLQAQLKEAERLNTNLREERESLKRQVADMEAKVDALSRRLLPEPFEDGAANAQAAKQESRGDTPALLWAAVPVALILAGAALALRRRFTKAPP